MDKETKETVEQIAEAHRRMLAALEALPLADRLAYLRAYRQRLEVELSEAEREIAELEAKVSPKH